MPEDSHERMGTNWTARISVAVLAILATTLIVQQIQSPTVTMRPVNLIQKARQQSLAWNGFTLEMQEEADKVRRLHCYIINN